MEPTLTNQPHTLSVVIPVYNSQDSLPPLVERLEEALKPICSDFEVVLVNDGSRDNSWPVITSLAAQYPFVRGINLMRNYGQHNAVLCGVRAARFELVVTMDDDLQHPPEEIVRLVKKLDEGYDVVYGSPQKMPHSFWRNVASRISKRTLAFVMNVGTIREISAFRVFRTDLRRAFETYQSPGVILDVLLSWGTSRFASLQVDEHPRSYGHSNYNFTRLAKQVFLILTGFSTMPLRFASWLGFTFVLFGLIIFLYVLYVYFALGSIPGFPFLASIVALFSGVQLFALGLIGEYLARIFDRSMDRPPYVVGSIIQSNPSTEQEPG